MADEQRKVILTGGPGCGKTAVLDFLGWTGQCGICPEAPRIVYDRETAKSEKNPGYVPVTYMTDLPLFERYSMIEQVVQEAMQSERCHSNLIIHDRSLVDIIAYCELFKIPHPEGIFESLARAGYDSLVFLLSPLLSYKNDYMRKESPEEAIKVQDKIAQVYSRLGFEIVMLPSVGWDNRACMIYERLESTPKKLWMPESVYCLSR